MLPRFVAVVVPWPGVVIKITVSFVESSHAKVFDQRREHQIAHLLEERVEPIKPAGGGPGLDTDVSMGEELDHRYRDVAL
jgi:hypothetical protein